MRYPYTLFKVKSKLSIMWHARFWNETQLRYAYSRTTGVLVEGKRKARREAEGTAKKLYDEFIAQKKEAEVGIIKQLTYSKPAVKTVADSPLIEYLSNFWSALKPAMCQFMCQSSMIIRYERPLKG